MGPGATVEYLPSSYWECLDGSDELILENVSHRNIDDSVKDAVHAMTAAPERERSDIGA